MATPHPPGGEQRKSIRYSCILDATFEGAGPKVFQPPILARVFNISQGGLGMHVGERFEAGTLLNLELRSSSRRTRLKARVVHIAEQPNGSWMMGMEFLAELSAQEIQDLVS